MERIESSNEETIHHSVLQPSYCIKPAYDELVGHFLSFSGFFLPWLLNQENDLLRKDRTEIEMERNSSNRVPSKGKTLLFRNLRKSEAVFSLTSIVGGPSAIKGHWPTRNANQSVVVDRWPLTVQHRRSLSQSCIFFPFKRCSNRALLSLLSYWFAKRMPANRDLCFRNSWNVSRKGAFSLLCKFLLNRDAEEDVGRFPSTSYLSLIFNTIFLEDFLRLKNRSEKLKTQLMQTFETFFTNFLTSFPFFLCIKIFFYETESNGQWGSFIPRLL